MSERWSPPAGVVLGGYRPGALASVVALHMDYYALHWNFGRAFETKVAGELAAFLERFDPVRDLFLAAYDPTGVMLGAITIDAVHAAQDGAHLRWFVVTDKARGTGLGRGLLSRAVSFCDAQSYRSVYLTTFAGLDAARHLYESVGFVMTSQSEIDQWQGGVREQRFERLRPAVT